MRYENGDPISNPSSELVTYHACKALGCLPSELEEEDAGLISRMILIDSVVNKRQQERAKKLMEK